MNDPKKSPNLTVTQDIGKPSGRARLVALTGKERGRVYQLWSRVILGRETSADILLEGTDVSRHHATIFRGDGGAWIVEDLNSSNGTYINGLAVTAPQELRFGDRLQVGGSVLFIFTHHDVLEDQVLQLQKMESMGKLAGEVAHDFRNLLTIIFTGLDFLLLNHKEGSLRAEENLDEEMLRTTLERMMDASERAGDLIHRLLSFARPGKDKVSRVDLGKLASEAVELFGGTEPGEVTVEERYDPDLWVKGDPTQLHQVLMNLLINAREAMPGGGRIRVVTQGIELDTAGDHDLPSTPGDMVVLNVSDSGVGMDEKTRTHAFEPFFSTKGADRGTGLGLASVYAIVKNHSGHIKLESAEGSGTVFQIFLPRCHGEQETE